MKKMIQKNVGKWVSFNFGRFDHFPSKARILSYDSAQSKVRIRRPLLDNLWITDEWHEFWIMNVKPLSPETDQYIEKMIAHNVKETLDGLKEEIQRKSHVVLAIESAEFVAGFELEYMKNLRDELRHSARFCLKHGKREEAEGFIHLSGRVKRLLNILLEIMAESNQS